MSADPAIVLAAFGAGQPDALDGILAVWDRVKTAFPDLQVELSFTSRFMRNRWRKYREDDAFRRKHPEISENLYDIKSPLAAVAQLGDDGVDTVIVQPLHVFAGEEYANLQSMIRALNSIETVKPKQRPFKQVILGRPALGEPGPLRPYQEDIERAVDSLAPDAEKARSENASLVYVGHGNRFYPSSAYMEFETAFRHRFPDLHTFVGVVEGFPGPEPLVHRLVHVGAERVHLYPLLLVVGVHAGEDLAGDEEGSFKSAMEKAGLQVDFFPRPLGSVDSWADIYVEHIRQAAEDHGIAI
jgi:sirohydrochlorin cobaltochelatase